jgi:sensor c-di-GMP phosphodiesterase-like protein
LLDLDVVCEGIETRHQVEAIARLGKCAIQGYFIAKPMNFDAMTDWIKSKRNIGALKTQADLPLLFDKPGNGHQKILSV